MYPARLATGTLLSATTLLGAAIVLAVYALVGGRSFCAWVCPVNPVSDLAAWARHRLRCHGRFRIGRGVRHGALALSLVLSAALGVAAFEWVSPIGMLQRELVHGVGLGVLGAAGIFALDLCVLRRGWCASLCPLGAFWGLVGRVALLRIGFDAARCDRCGHCVRACPEPQVLRFDEMGERGLVASGECLNCARCIEVCPRDALGVALRPLARRASGLHPKPARAGSRRRSACDAA